MSNDFTEETRTLNLYHPYCRKCNRNRECSLHHIYGRISKSAINSILLCSRCHSEADSFNQITGIKGTPIRKELLKLQLKFLVEQEYRFTEEDKEFLTVIQQDILDILQ